jgi:hypothetical protein
LKIRKNNYENILNFGYKDYKFSSKGERGIFAAAVARKRLLYM